MTESKSERRPAGPLVSGGVWAADAAAVAGKLAAACAPRVRRPKRTPLARRGVAPTPPDVDAPHADLAAIEIPSPRVRLVALPMFVADVAALIVTCAAAFAITRLFLHIPYVDLVAVSAALFAPVALGNLLTGLYPGVGSNPVVEFRQLSRVSAIAFFGIAAFAVFGRLGTGWYLFFALAAPMQFAFAPLSRAAVRRLCSGYRWWGYPVLVFGAGRAATTVIQNLLDRPSYGLRPVAVLDPTKQATTELLGLPVLGTPRLAAAAAKKLGLKHAIVVLPDMTRGQATRCLEKYAKGIRHVMITSAISPFAPGLPILWRDPRDLAGVAGVEVRNRLLVPTPRLIKRCMDVVLTIGGGLCLLPLLIALAVCVRCGSRGPVLFSHTRIGARGKRFKAMKFRSMVTNGDEVLAAYLAANPEAKAEWERDHKLKDDPRVTRIGAFMRKCSLDELPQLWNVLRGQMSLVGPRPIVKAEIEKYGKCYNIYKAVRPGITGLWQVSGRNDTTYDERLRFDEFYVRNWSPWLDMHLLARTVSALLFSKGAY